VTDEPFDRASLEATELGPAEARRYLDAPISDAEREDVLALVRWFRHRYRTPIERLAYVRRAYARWQRTRGIAGPARIAGRA
jgi:hypothetical protein